MSDTEKPTRRRAAKSAEAIGPPSDEPAQPGWDFELAALGEGKQLIAGCDEVGRGSWAGPLVAAAVIFPPDLIAAAGDAAQEDESCLLRLADLEGVRDSKQLTPERREELDVCVRRQALTVGLGLVSPALCDAIGMGAANRLAMVRAVRALGLTPELLLLDAFRLPLLRLPQLPIIKGDARSYSIAAASIVAKVARDRMMAECDAEWPAFGFGKHKGYGTAEHAAALLREGPTPLHRRCFAPVREALERQ